MANKRQLDDDDIDGMSEDEMRSTLRDLAAQKAYGSPGGGGGGVAGTYAPGGRPVSSERDAEFVGDFAQRWNDREQVSQAERNRFTYTLLRDHVTNAVARNGNSKLAEVLRQAGYGQD